MSTWYLRTNLPAPGSNRAHESAIEPADLTEIVRLYGLRVWVEQSYKMVKGSLGWAEYQVRKDVAMRRHWQLVICAFSFCWWALSSAEVDDLELVEGCQPASTAASIEASAAPRAGEKKSAPRAGGDVAGGVAAGQGLPGAVSSAMAVLAGVVVSAPTAAVAAVA